MPRTSPNTGPPVAALSEGELHIWVADLDCTRRVDSRARRHDLLSADERERAQRFASKHDAARWVCSHALLRLLLGHYLSADPAALRFETEEHGKPHLTGEHSRLRFNMSHSGAIGLYAISLGLEVGVDVERPRRGLDELAVAERAFGRATAGRLRRLDQQEREQAFLRLWVRHEARLKCLGVGLGWAKNSAGNRACWTMDVGVGGLSAAAIAALRQPARVECWRAALAQCEDW